MNERELFRKTFDKLHASEDVEKEIIAMSEKKRLNPLRPVAAVCACLAVMVCSAFAADAATGGELFRSIRTVFGVQEIRQEVFHTEGIEAVAWTEISGGEDLPEDAVGYVNLGEHAGAYLTGEGRVMLRESGKEDRDVTEAWSQGGTFTLGGEDYTVEVFTDEAGNKLYQCTGVRAPEADIDKVFLNGGMLFDADQFDLSSLPGFKLVEGTDYGNYEEGDVATYTVVLPDVEK